MLQVRSAFTTLPPQIQGSIDQIEWHTDPGPISALGFLLGMHKRRRNVLEAKFLHSSFSSCMRRQNGYLARPFPAAGAKKKKKKNKMSSSTRPFFSTGN